MLKFMELKYLQFITIHKKIIVLYVVTNMYV